jgi:anthranilate phosphoribosyltransferase
MWAFWSGAELLAVKKRAREAARPLQCCVRGSALQEGIKAVAIGKHGAKPVPESILEPLKVELERVEHQLQVFKRQGPNMAADDPASSLNIEQVARRASFLASLFLKYELLPAEAQLLQHCIPKSTASLRLGRERCDCFASDVLQTLCTNLLPESKAFRLGVKLLSAQVLSREEAMELASIVLSCNANTMESPAVDITDVVSFRALTMHTMRVRHETSDELLGMAEAANSAMSPSFRPHQSSRQSRPPQRYVQLAEPFDGFERPGCLFTTPIIAWHLQERWGIANVVGAMGDSPGPKYGPNLKSVALELSRALGPHSTAVNFAQNLDDIFKGSRAGSRCFNLVDQAVICPALYDLLPLRRSIVKRPGWSTVEKFVGCAPEQCSVLIASAFHPPYTKRMIEVSMGLGLSGAIIIRKGIEGTLSIAPDSNFIELACCARRADHTYEQIELKVQPSVERVKTSSPANATVSATLTAAENARLLRNYYQSRTSCGDEQFDRIIQATLACVDAGMQWLMEHIHEQGLAGEASSSVPPCAGG